MNNLQTVSIIAAFPLAMVIVLIIASFIKDARCYMVELTVPAPAGQSAAIEAAEHPAAPETVSPAGETVTQN
jgi:BCCT family betaine/carnitine transporter